jgi:hypothetical protein
VSRPDSEALARLASVWAAGLSGAIRSSFIGGRAVLLRGEPRDDVDCRWIESACRAGPIEFTPASDFGQPPGASLMDLLWGLADERANPAMLQRARHGILVDGMASRALPRLPLTAPTRAVLAARQVDLDLEQLLASTGVDRAEVWRQLAQLVGLGALKLRIPPGAKPYPDEPAPRPAPRVRKPRSRPPRQTPRPTPKKPPRRKPPPDNARVLTRLRSEWRVIESASDHVVLGISPSMDDETVATACRRMARRYRRLANEDALEPEARQLASQIHARIVEAVKRVRKGAVRSVSGDPFDAGQTAISAGDWSRALKCFALARKASEDPANLAWFGWAMYNDPSRPAESRRRKGRDHMELAESMSATRPDASFLLARADVFEGDLVRAWTRLDKLTEAFPEHTEARQLLVQVQKDIRS